MEFGKILAIYRKQQNLSQRGLAQLAGVSHTYISKLESGSDIIPSDSVIESLARALRIPTLTLMLAAGKLPPTVISIWRDMATSGVIPKVLEEMNMEPNRAKQFTEVLKNLPLLLEEATPDELYQISQTLEFANTYSTQEGPFTLSDHSRGDIRTHFPIVPIPVLRTLRTHDPIPNEDEIIDWTAITQEQAAHGSYFALRVPDDSMNGGQRPICEGDVVLVMQQKSVDNGQMAVVHLPDTEEAQIRRVYIKNDQAVLQAEHRAYSPWILHKKKLKIRGRVVGLVAHFD